MSNNFWELRPIVYYPKLSLRDDHYNFILYVGANDLKLEKTPECIAE